MPLFEYQCRSCGRRFEFLTRGAETPACPACESADPEKQLSVFAVGGAAAQASVRAGAPAACGMCGDPRGPGACSMNN